MNIVPLTFGQWLPDTPAFNNPGVWDAKNVIPRTGYYEEFAAVDPSAGADREKAVVGYHSFIPSNGTFQEIIGTSTHLWQNATKASSAYTATHWSIASFGDRVIACDLNNSPQYWDVGGGNFATLAGSPPKAKYVTTLRDFVVLANLDDGTAKPNYVRWSGFNNSELWEKDLATQADEQELFNAGEIQGIVGGEVGYVFTDRTIFRMSYTGPPTIFRFDEIGRGRGTIAPDSIVQRGNDIFYYDNEGFYLFDGQNFIPIGANRIDEWFKWFGVSSATPTGLIGAHDPKNQCIFWAVKTASHDTQHHAWEPVATTGSTGVKDTSFYDHLVIYNYTADQWSYASFLDMDVGNGVSWMAEQKQTSLLGDSFRSSVIAWAQDSNKDRRLNGGATSTGSQVVSREITPSGGRRVLVNAVRPLVDAPSRVRVAGGSELTASLSLAIETRVRLDASAVAGQTYTLADDGEFKVASEARYTRFRLRSNYFDHIQGLELAVDETGRY